jgi:hypothetical protein
MILLGVLESPEAGKSARDMDGLSAVFAGLRDRPVGRPERKLALRRGHWKREHPDKRKCAGNQELFEIPLTRDSERRVRLGPEERVERVVRCGRDRGHDLRGGR